MCTQNDPRYWSKMAFIDLNNGYFGDLDLYYDLIIYNK